MLNQPHNHNGAAQTSPVSDGDPAAVAPGPISTEGTEGMREAQGYLASLAPARRLGTAQEIAAAIVYLASPEAAFTHGVVLPVDGGRVAV